MDENIKVMIFLPVEIIKTRLLSRLYLVYVLNFDVKNPQHALKRINDMKKLYFKTTFIIMSVNLFNGGTGY